MYVIIYTQYMSLYALFCLRCVPIGMLWNIYIYIVKANRHAVECNEGVCQSACCGMW